MMVAVIVETAIRITRITARRTPVKLVLCKPNDNIKKNNNNCCVLCALADLPHRKLPQSLPAESPEALMALGETGKLPSNFYLQRLQNISNHTDSINKTTFPWVQNDIQA